MTDVPTPRKRTRPTAAAAPVPAPRARTRARPETPEPATTGRSTDRKFSAWKLSAGKACPPSELARWHELAGTEDDLIENGGMSPYAGVVCTSAGKGDLYGVYVPHASRSAIYVHTGNGRLAFRQWFPGSGVSAYEQVKQAYQKVRYGHH